MPTLPVPGEGPASPPPRDFLVRASVLTNPSSRRALDDSSHSRSTWSAWARRSRLACLASAAASLRLAEFLPIARRKRREERTGTAPLPPRRRSPAEWRGEGGRRRACSLRGAGGLERNLATFDLMKAILRRFFLTLHNTLSRQKPLDSRSAITFCFPAMCINTRHNLCVQMIMCTRRFIFAR